MISLCFIGMDDEWLILMVLWLVDVGLALCLICETICKEVRGDGASSLFTPKLDRSYSIFR